MTERVALRRAFCALRKPIWFAAALAAVLVCAVVGAAGEETGPAPGDLEMQLEQRLEALRSQRTAAADPVAIHVLGDEARLAEAELELARQRRRRDSMSLEAAREQGRLAELRQSLMGESNRVATVGDCQRLLGEMRRSEERLSADLAEFRRNLSILGDMVDATGARRTVAVSTAAMAREGTLEDLPLLDQWPESWRQRFEQAQQRLPEAYDELLGVLGSLTEIAQASAGNATSTIAFLQERSAEVDATKNRLFWRREPIPYSLDTVRQAWADLKGLSGATLALLKTLPLALGKAVGELRRAGLLWRVVASTLLLAGGVWLLLALGGRLKGCAARRAAVSAEMLRVAEERRAGASRGFRGAFESWRWRHTIELMLLRCVSGEGRYWLAAPALAGLWLLFTALQEAVLRAAAADPELAGAIGQGVGRYRLAIAIGATYAVIGIYRLLKRLTRDAISPTRGGERLLRLPAPRMMFAPAS